MVKIVFKKILWIKFLVAIKQVFAIYVLTFIKCEVRRQVSTRDAHNKDLCQVVQCSYEQACW